MENILINEDFNKSIKKLRSVLPTLSFGLLIATYLISAIIMGIFHAQKATDIGFMITAFLVPLAIQMGRGTLVFFFQLNPIHIQGKYSFGIIAATTLLLLSLIEAYLVLSPYGFSWIISVSTLMVIGWIIEIMILKETIFATQIELFRNKERLEEVKSFYIARSELRLFLENVNNRKIPALPEAVKDEPQEMDLETKLEPEIPPEESKIISLLNELNQHLEGKVSSPSLNGQAKGKNS